MTNHYKLCGSSDRWQVLKVYGDVPHYRLMLTWYDNLKTKTPGYWRMYTIKDLKETDNYLNFYTIQDKVYRCLKDVDYGTATFGEIFLMLELPKQEIPFEVMEWDTKWSEINWKIYETKGK